MRVREAREHRPAAGVDALGVGELRAELGGRAERRDAAIAHGKRRVVEDRPGVVGRDDRRVVDQLGRRHRALLSRGAARQSSRRRRPVSPWYGSGGNPQLEGRAMRDLVKSLNELCDSAEFEVSWYLKDLASG